MTWINTIFLNKKVCMWILKIESIFLKIITMQFFLVTRDFNALFSFLYLSKFFYFSVLNYP